MHLFEYAKSGRSSCKGPKKTCPVTDRSIRQGELRLGVETESPRNLLFWRHWCCTTPKVIENLQAAYSEPSEIQGWDTLREDDQERIQRAWDLGRIPENELPEPAAEHTDPSAKRKGSVDLPPTNEIAAEREKDKKKRTKGDKDATKNDDKKTKDGKTKSTEKNTKKKSSVKKEEVNKLDDVKEEEKSDVEMEDSTSKKQDTMITRKPEKAPEEPKVASYASRKKAPQKESKEPTRRSKRVAANKNEEPASKRKGDTTEGTPKKQKKATK